MFPASVNEIMEPTPHSESGEPEIKYVEVAIRIAKSRMLSSKSHAQ
jgi:hypothetical protein